MLRKGREACLDCCTASMSGNAYSFAQEQAKAEEEILW